MRKDSSQKHNGRVHGTACKAGKAFLLLVGMGYLSEEEMVVAYSENLSVPHIRVANCNISKRCSPKCRKRWHAST